MVYLAESPLGSMAVHDFKLSQFVIVDGEVGRIYSLIHAARIIFPKFI